MNCDTTKMISNAVGGKTARPCDSCIRRRARWYCAADDAFLCQLCDRSVHSANSLARRHHRVRLKTASSNTQPDPSVDLPPWQRGLTRKARTPRQGKKANGGRSKSEESIGLNPAPTVPDLGSEDTTSSHGDETDDLVLCRVPVFDLSMELKSSQNGYETFDTGIDHMDMDMDGTELETLLGRGLDGESYGIEELGLLDSTGYNEINENIIFHGDHLFYDYAKLVKSENSNALLGYHNIEQGVEIRERLFDLSFDVHGDDFPSQSQGGQSGLQGPLEEERVTTTRDEGLMEEKVKKRKTLTLRLDYEAISVAWETRSKASPWIDGQRPKINANHFWPNCMESELFGGNNYNGVMKDGSGREARVSRYREKRRKRLYSKKIRYQVRKLNAEKRPRIKGRFVKTHRM